eukprot:jgi/Picre1/32110/NNA_007458.t1
MLEHGVEQYGGKSYPPLRFSHLVGYAELLQLSVCKLIASQVWDGLEEHGMPSTDVMHRRMLACGGSKPAKQYVEDLLSVILEQTRCGREGSTSDTVTGGTILISMHT